ncbi:MAG: hypothetical protein HKO65_02465 [Gemmatimonadetes bacterium]|nr:hypothetical protein [Gemmatimonadota bacterium]
MMRKRKILFGLGVLVLYNILTGGGPVYLSRDRLETFGQDGEPVRLVELVDGANVYFAETPTTRAIGVPFVVYYVRKSYPFRIRYYGSTRDGSITVSDRPFEGPETNVVVTDVRYYRESELPHEQKRGEVFRVNSWSEIVIAEPGVWTVESRGYVRYGDGSREELDFPTVTLRPGEERRLEVMGGISYLIGGMLR